MRAAYPKALLVTLCLTALSACAALAGGSHPSDTRSTLIAGPLGAPATLSIHELDATLQREFATWPALATMIGAPACGVRVYKFVYGTVGGRGEPTDASGALMVPTGYTAQCRGPRPIVL